MARALRVSVDARPLDIPSLRAQGIGRYAHGLLGPLAEVAAERGGELVLLRERQRGPAVFGPGAPAAATLTARRPRLRDSLAEWPEQVLLPLDLRRAGGALHHALSIYRAAVFPGVPSVMTMHDVAPLMWPDQYLRTGVAHRMLYRAARRARLLLAVSETARRDVIAHLGVPSERVLCIPEAADEHFRPSDSRPIRERLGLTDPYLLFVGGLAAHDPRKNLEGLIDAYAAWRRERAGRERLVLAGRLGPAAEELRLRAERAGAPVTFTGFVADEELPALMSGATCMVTSARYEGFGLPALEAISCGAPVVAFDAGAVREVAGPGCLLAPDGDGAALMRAVARVCDEPGLRERLGEDGRRHSRRYSWRRTAELTWEAYEAAQAGGSSP